MTKNDQSKGISYNQLIELLGEPEKRRDTNNTIYYEIKTNYGAGVDLIFSKTLEITLHRDSAVKGYKVIEWKR